MSSNEPEESTPFLELLSRISEAFDSACIPYMVFGGQAVLLYGEPRFTQDIDVTLGVGPTESSAVLATVEKLGFQILVDSPEVFLKETFVLPVRDPVSGIRVDLVFSLSEFERQAIGRASRIKMGQWLINFVTVEDLIIFKIIAARPRDLEDVKGILLKNPNYDRDYVLRWLMEYDIALGEGFEGRLFDVEIAVDLLNSRGKRGL